MTRQSNALRNHGTSAKRLTATALRHTTVVGSQPSPERKKFTAVILKIPASRLALAAGCSKDAAKLWKTGRRIPNYPNMARLARSIPSVNAYVRDDIDPDIETDRVLTDTITTLLRLADQPGRDGDRARMALRDLARRGNG